MVGSKGNLVPKETETRVHEASLVHPDMSEDDFDALVVSVREQGVREAVRVIRREDVLWIVDGRHRWRAAQLAGVECPYVEVKDGDDFDVVWREMDSEVRRHSSARERVQVVLRLIGWEPTDDPTPGTPIHSMEAGRAVTNAEIAAKAGCAPVYVEKIRQQERAKVRPAPPPDADAKLDDGSGGIAGWMAAHDERAEGGRPKPAASPQREAAALRGKVADLSRWRGAAEHLAQVLKAKLGEKAAGEAVRSSAADVSDGVFGALRELFPGGGWPHHT